MRYTMSILIVLSMMWLVSSGHTSPLLLGLGLMSVVFVVWIAHRMNVVDAESQPIHLSLKLPSFYAWLLLKIVQANIDVVSHVWRPRLSISPCTDAVACSQKTNMGRVIFANSITLTPGTVALDMDEDQIWVHSLTRKNLDELKAGEMNRRIAQLE